jgi:hypothetical protein
MVFRLFFFCLLLISLVQAQDFFDWSTNFRTPRRSSLNYSRSSYNENSQNWPAIIDSIWGEGLPAAEKLAIFDTVWNTIDAEFACFHHLEIDWDEIRNKYRPEIEHGVSKGRFAAIMNHMSLALQESHTWFDDLDVSSLYYPLPGTPLLYAGGWGMDSHFGACLTPLADSSLLVYKAIDNHPLGLIPGDIVLGYQGIPWKELYKILLAEELPIGSQGVWGANAEAFTHCWLQGAGINWHLFDTLNVIKYTSGDTVNLPTILLVDQEMDIFGTEQLPVAGITYPDSIRGQDIGWGIMEGTNIGYIYVWSWYRPNPAVKFRNAVDSLMSVYDADGMIIDMRYNAGGFVSASDGGLRLLYDDDFPNLGLAYRNNTLDHFQMNIAARYNLSGDTVTHFDKPIAVLLGPNAFSACDFIALRLKAMPRVRIFGKTSASAFAAQLLLPINTSAGSGWDIRYAGYNGFLEEETMEYLTRIKIEVDEEVWFKPEDVYYGKDSIVEAALAWINSEISSIAGQTPVITDQLVLHQNYPNPFNQTSVITFELPFRLRLELSLYNLLGEKIKTIYSGIIPAGIHQAKIDGGDLSSGLYFYVLRANNIQKTGKCIVLK